MILGKLNFACQLGPPHFLRAVVAGQFRPYQQSAKYSIPRLSINKTNFLRFYTSFQMSKVPFNIHSFQTKSPEKTSLYLIKEACLHLTSFDSLIIDELSNIFGKNYILINSSLSEEESRENEELIVNKISEYVQNRKDSFADKEQNLKIYKNVQVVYEFLSASKIGFLRGDLHSQTYFQLLRYIEEKIKQAEATHRRHEIIFQHEDFKNILNRITVSQSFRLPEKGIYRRNLQSNVNLYQRQIIIQEVSREQSHDKITSILDFLIKLNKVQEAQAVRKFLIQWLVPFTAAIKEQQNKCKARDLSGNRRIYAQYLLQIEAQKLASIALTQLIIEIFEAFYRQGSIQEFQIQEYDGIEKKKYISKVIHKLQVQIAYDREQKIFKQAQKEYDLFLRVQMKEKELPKIVLGQENNVDLENNQEIVNQKKNLQEPRNWKSPIFLQKEKNSPYRFIPPSQRKEFLATLLKKMSHSKLQDQIIPEKAQTELGNMLIYFLKQLLKIKNKYGYKVPLLTIEHKYKKKNGQHTSVNLLRLNEYFLASLMPKLEKNENMFIHMQHSVPTIIEPLPWVQPEIGGYYSQATNVMRYSDCPVQQRLMKYADNYRIYQALNYLSRIPWKINKKVLQIVQNIWLEGGMQNCIPKRYSQVMNTYITAMRGERNIYKRKQLGRKIQQLRDQHSLRSDFLLKLNIARSFSRLDYFYFPNNVDFRGRVYPIPPHFNHIGNDLVRGLLLFGEGRKLGKGGLKWLKIHCANLMGKEKAVIDDKIDFINNSIEKIHQIATEPLAHREWLEFQDSWQAIATIMELSDALKFPNPQEFVSHLHIHQDGSCNGLQHYAALGRDLEGAYQVNLGPGQKPSDIYTHVSKMVIKMIEEELQGDEAPIHKLARKLPDNIKRKTIKQTVMTSVYGVTFIGAREQIYRQLRDQDFLNEDEAYQASIYLAKLTLKAISNLFKGAHGIKEWFRKCANLVGKTGNPVGWITPLGLPVVQPYRKAARIDLIKTISSTLTVPRSIENLKVNVMKQTSAFPPNYIHSLDSSHMMYTAEVCKQRNLTFAAVHDSFWTHAATVDEMNIILREQFIKLHSQPLLERFLESLQNRFPDIYFPPIPERGNFDLEKIKESLYFFS